METAPVTDPRLRVLLVTVRRALLMICHGIERYLAEE